jgi:hypothetical protein
MQSNLLCKLYSLQILSVGIHALINVHEYHCIAIRMRCRLMDACFLFSAAVLATYMLGSHSSRALMHVRRMVTNTRATLKETRLHAIGYS